jgi:hypothetical protein
VGRALSARKCAGADPASRIRGSGSRITLTETYTYRPQILEELARHGLCPLPSTSPLALRDAVRDLYRYEIKRLRSTLLAGHIARKDYAAHVIALRTRYPILSVPPALWTKTPDG